MAIWARYALAFVFAFAGAAALSPVAVRVARRFGVIDQPREGRHHSTPTPYLGGVAVAGGLVLVGAVAVGASGQLLTILLCGLAVGAVGLLDDWKGVRVTAKVAVEVAAGVALWLAGVSAGLFGIYPLDLALTVFWVVAVTNAFNMLDNMDGLSTGVAAIAALTFFAIAAGRGDYLVGSFALALAGAALGFLVHNFPPAKIFLGDAGSLLIGFLLAALALKMDLVGENGLVRGAIPVLILGVALWDMGLVVVSRARTGRPVYLGATDHSSHRLAARGLPAARVTLLTYAAQILCCVVALWLTHSTSWAALLAVPAIGAVGLLAMWRVLALPPPIREAAPAKMVRSNQDVLGRSARESAA